MSAPGLKITNFHYSHINLPASQPTEYPKWIHMSGYESVIAKDAEEEAKLLARAKISGDVTIKLQGVQAEATAAPIVDADAERAALIQVAQEKNIKIDQRWKTDRIRAELDKAQN